MNNHMISNKTQESINRLLRFNNVSNMTYSILEFSSDIISYIKEDDKLLVDVCYTTNRMNHTNTCNMTVCYYLNDDFSEMQTRETKIVVEVKIKRTGKKFERMLENIAYLIAADYVNRNWRMVSSEKVVIPEHLYDVKRKRCTKVTNSVYVKLISKIKDILFRYNK